ncbi:MAG: hypothetical protein IPM97_03315 [Bdellovibrionaceae bacterium]|nr:hypothetical protein [Pseudobdellovibrionaceae bacterium]
MKPSYVVQQLNITKTMKTSITIIIVLLISIAHSSPATAGYYSNEFNSFLLALQQSNFSTDKLWDFENPLVGKTQFVLPAKQAPWAGNYFAMQGGGIASRWQTNSHPSINERFPNRQQAMALTAAQIDKLSPIEKYDLYVGDYSFQATKHELTHRGLYRPQRPEPWEGFCNGVRCAGFSLQEPKGPIDVTNNDGIPIRFHPTDLKALAGASYFYVEKYTDIGRPSNGNEIAAAQPNPAIFDLALRFYIGVKKKSFVIDSHLGSEIWNESVVGFNRKIHDPAPLTKTEKVKFPGAVHKLLIETELYTLGEVDINETNGPTKKQVSNGEHLTATPVSYTLYINEDGKAFEGKWHKSKDEYGVDFAWFGSGGGADAKYAPDSPQESQRANGNKDLDFSVIRRLFKIAQKQAPLCNMIF